LLRTNANPVDDGETEMDAEPEVRLKIPTFVCHAGNCAEDIAEVHTLGFIVENDNEPAPENIPAPTENNNIAATNGLAWGWAGIDQETGKWCSYEGTHQLSFWNCIGRWHAVDNVASLLTSEVHGGCDYHSNKQQDSRIACYLWRVGSLACGSI
jgi:hypothetical protein